MLISKPDATADEIAKNEGFVSTGICPQPQGCTALVDSGTSLITAPSFAVDKILSSGQLQLDPECDNFDSMPKERWEFISDQVMGGVSHGNVKFFSSSSQSFARMTGNVSTKNNGGFIQFRRMLTSYFKKNKQLF